MQIPLLLYCTIQSVGYVYTGNTLDRKDVEILAKGRLKKSEIQYNLVGSFSQNLSKVFVNAFTDLVKVQTKL